MMNYSYNACIGIFFMLSAFFMLFNISEISALENNTVSQNPINYSIDNVYSYEPFLLLNGTEYLDIPHSDKIILENFTVASWVRVNESDLSNPAILVNKGGFNSDDKGKNMNYGFWFSSKGIIQGGFETESGEYFAVNSTDKYNDGKWHYILLSNDGNQLKLYVDGKPISTKVTEGIKPDNTGSQPLRIGANSLEEDKFFKGDIDEVRVWNRGLIDNQVDNLYGEVTDNTNILNDQILYLNFSDANITQSVTVTQDETKNSFADATEYKVVKVWGGAGSGDGQFLRPHDLDFNPDEKILYAVDRDGSRIQAFDKDGTFLFKFGEDGTGDGQMHVPYGIDVDTEGNIWLADRANDRVQKFDNKGKFILKFGNEDGVPSSEPGKFDNPRHVVVDKDLKNVYVADSKNNRISQFDIQGNYIKSIGTLGDKPGEFNLPTTIEIDSKGNFFVNERGNERIQKFDSNWNPILMWGSKGSGDSQFCHIEHIALDKYDNVYVTDPQSDPGCSQVPVVKKFDNDGNFIAKWGDGFGKEDGQLQDPEHLAVDSEGNVYISDRKRDDIQKFAPIQ